MSTPTPWPSDVLAWYLTAGNAPLDITHAPHSGHIVATCHGCGTDDHTSTGGFATDPPEQEQQRVAAALPASKHWAQAHAATCRAHPEPDGAP